MTPNWKSYHWHTPQQARSWLMEKGSLTQRLRESCSGQFHLTLEYQAFERPDLDEIQALNLKSGQRALVREVLLWCDDEPVVWARSILPYQTLQNIHHPLGNLGTKPLGDILFSHPHIHRGEIEVAEVEYNNAPHWARRSVFEVEGWPILVSETFLQYLD